MVLKTKFGNATIDTGYYRITSKKEGNFGKLLHRLIYEDFYKVCLISNVVIHHKDGNKLNNSVSNLQAMTKGEHHSLHNAGENHPMYNKYHSKLSRMKISEFAKNRKYSLEDKLNMSKSRNTTGYFRVSKQSHKDCKQGFIWRYSYVDKVTGKRKAIRSVSIEQLKERVISKGLTWKEYNSTKKEILEGA